MRFLTKKISDVTADVIVGFKFEDDVNNSKLFDYLNNLSDGCLSKQVFEFNSFKGKFQETFNMSIDSFKKLFLVGLGKKNELTRKKFFEIISSISRTIKSYSKNSTIAFELFENNFNSDCVQNFSKAQCAKMILIGSRIGFYDFDKYKSSKPKLVETIEILDDNINPEIEKELQIGVYTSFAMKFAKDLVNESAQIVTPKYIADLAQEIANEHKFECKIYDKNQIKELKMNAFLAVGQGSVNEPKFVHLIYKPKNQPRKKVALVGKGITFDAGGMNIKPAASMLTMKSDMTGTASVLGIIQAISKLNSDIELHVICALCENMTSGSAYKQGDVLTAMNGKTIEVDNTDAEGRLTLADALCYADKLSVDEVIDIATLTGAVIVSLGNNITGIMGNNQEQIDKFVSISKKSGENVWQMPILDELKYNLKSNIADMKNTGGRLAGTSTAAWFLSNFTKSSSWMHLDIAGTAYIDKSNRETLYGPTGVMIRTLIDYLLS